MTELLPLAISVEEKRSILLCTGDQKRIHENMKHDQKAEKQ